jgi:type IV pilus assembly protein PilP
MRTTVLLLVVLATAVSVAHGQTPAPRPGPAAAPSPSAGAAQPPAAGAAAPPQPENYTYEPEGRRDPFLSLIGSGGGDTRVSRKGDGPTGLSVADISVRGVMQSRGALIAMIQGPDNKTYIVHSGDKLLDGTIKSITAQGLIVIQEVNDPLSLVKQREVSKLLRSLEGGK